MWSPTYQNYQSYVFVNSSALRDLINQYMNPYLEDITPDMQHVVQDTTVNNLPVESDTTAQTGQAAGDRPQTKPLGPPPARAGPAMRKEEPMTPKEMALLLAQALDSKKGKDIRVLETDSVTTLADYFVLCTGTSAPQLKALADAGERAMKEAGILPHHVEGHRGGTWILQDYGDVVVHLFDKEARAFYDLDRLWEEAKVVALSQVLQPGE